LAQRGWNRVEIPKTSQLIAKRIAGRILRGELKPGDFLPPEGELARELGISRMSLREGLRVLETQGLVSVRAGRKGGIRVEEPDTRVLASTLTLLIQVQKVSLESILEARIAVESVCARLAALRRNPESCQALQRSVQSVELDDTWYAHAVDFHVCLGYASGNPVLALIVDALHEIIFISAYQGHLSEDKRKETVRAHQKIVEAIFAGDADAAERRVRKHLEAFAKTLEEIYGKPLSDIYLECDY